MSILVTGGAGYIGSHTCVELLNKEEKIVIVDNFSNSKPEVLEKIKEITNKDFKFYEVDLLNKETNNIENESWIKEKIEERMRAKTEKNYQKADEIRNELLEKGIILKDGRDGTTFERK